MVKLSKFKIAKTQLEEAIVQHLDKENYIAAITLAGAAEEILGKALPSGKTQALHKLARGIKAQHPLLVLLDRKGQPQKVKDMQDGDIVHYLNRTKNNLKHIETDFIEIAPEEESIAMLSRALTNYTALRLTPSAIVKRGIKFFEEYAAS